MGFMAGFAGVVFLVFCVRRWQADERAERALALAEGIVQRHRQLSDREMAEVFQAVTGAMHGTDRDMAGYLRRARGMPRSVIAMQLLAARTLATPATAHRLDRLRALVAGMVLLLGALASGCDGSVPDACCVEVCGALGWPCHEECDPECPPHACAECGGEPAE